MHETTYCEESKASWFKRHPQEWKAFHDSLSEDEARFLDWDWRFWGRPKQLPPPGDWETWLILAGRGWGKTRTGAEWIIDQVQNHGARNVALVGPTVADVRDVMIRGLSGILACSPPWFKATYQPTNRLIMWPNGAQALTYSADEPQQLRGPNVDAAWVDELAKNRYDEAWDQLQFTLRVGTPKCLVTTTPRPTKLIKKLAADPHCVVVTGSTFENTHLAGSFLEKIRRQYDGTRLGRQELYAEILEDAPGALWKRWQIDENRIAREDAFYTDGPRKGELKIKLTRIVVAVDPAVSEGENAAEHGIVVVGVSPDYQTYLLEDGSLSGSPGMWGKQAVALYHRWQADCIVGEVNQGGDLVKANIRTVDQNVPFKAVRATKGKAVRAGPVANIAEQGRHHHVGFFPELEDQLVQWEPDAGMKSPDRLDAMVWAVSELIELGPPAPIPNESIFQHLPSSRWDNLGGRGF